MKNKFLILLIAVTSVLTSCKKDKEVEEVDNKDVKKYFSVEIDATAAKTDDFAMFFSENGTIDFKQDNVAWRGINGGKDEKIVYTLSEEKIPTHIRLDFGLKTDQDSVVVKNVKVDYYGNTYQFKGSDFFNYFIKDDQFFTKVDQAKGTMTILAKDGLFKKPYFYPTQLTIDKIKEITTKK